MSKVAASTVAAWIINGDDADDTGDAVEDLA